MIKALLIKLSLLVFALCLSGWGYGQVITISEDIPVKNDDAYKVIGKFGEKILLYMIDGNNHEIIVFSRDMLQKSERMLDFEKLNADILALVPGDTSFHVIYGYKEKGDYYLKHRVYDSRINLIDSTTLDVLPKMYFNPQFIVVTSEDESKLLLVRTDRESDISIKSYDLATKTVLWQKQIIFEGVSYRRDFRQALVTNKGDMYIIMDHEKNSRRFKEFVIVSIQTGSGTLRKKNISLDDLIAHDIHATFDNLNEQLVISGMYNEKISGKSLGLYVFKMDHISRGITMSTVELNAEILDEVYGKPVADDKGVSDFRVAGIIMRQDGGMIVLSEMQKEYSRRPNIPIRSSTVGPGGWVDYYYEDVMVFSLHPNGDLHWQTLLHKKQYSQDDDAMYSSFFVFRTPEKLRILYNDEIRHESTVSEYVIRGNGYHKRNSVFSTDYQKLGLRFRDAMQVGYYECVIPSERNNRLNLVRITYNEENSD